MLRTLRRYLSFAFLLALFINTTGLFFSAALAEDQSFDLQINRRSIPLDEKLDLSFNISGGSYDSFDFPTNTDDYQVIGKASSSQISLVNGVMSQQRKLVLSLQMKHEGKVTIPSASVKIGGKKFTSNPVTITVTEPIRSMGAVKPGTNIPPPVNQTRAGNRNLPRITSDSVFAVAEVSNANPYQNQQILLKIKMYHRGNLQDLQLPVVDMDGFSKEQIKEAQEYNDFYKNQEYLVYEIGFILFPLKKGTLTIPKFVIEGNALEEEAMDPRDPFAFLTRSFRVIKPIRVETKPITINVKALPGGAPKGFTGYVGELSVNNSLSMPNDSSKKIISAGEAITLVTKVYGDGNLNLLDFDKLIKDSSKFNIFKDQSKSSAEIENKRKYSETTSRIAIVPKKKGRKEINVRPFVSFNPILKRYEEHGAKKFVIKVGPPKDPQLVDGTPSKSKTTLREVESKKDILNISIEQLIKGKKTEIPFNYALLLLLFINLIPILIFLFRKLGNVELLQSFSKGKRISFSSTEKEINAANSITDVSILIKELVSKLESNGSKLSDGELGTKIKDLYTKFDHGNYGMADVDLSSIKTESLNLVKELRNVR